MASAAESKRRRVDSGAPSFCMANRARLQSLFAEGRLVHPMKEGTESFADLAHALALCCGLAPARRVRHEQADKLAAEMGGTGRRHIVMVLCDGMGSNLFDQHLEAESFLRQHNDPERLLAIFPATTPAALTTLATAAWPGQHGLPGWQLRDQKGCEFPGEVGHGPVQLTILDKNVRDMRSRKPAAEVGFHDVEDIYVAPTWTSQGDSKRKMKFINAYNTTDFTKWYQDRNSESAADIEAEITADIQETAFETIGKPEGSEKALEYFNRGVDLALESVAEAEKESWSSYIYLYTAHPDKHMHTLGTSHPEVRNIMRGLDAGIERLWAGLKKTDSTLVVTADHGHITVKVDEMVELSAELLDCLEYANIGILGPGRHAYFHCRSGRHAEFQALWAAEPQLREHFVLLTVDAAAEEGLFGPDRPVPKVRPRLGDFLAVSVGAHTLVTPKEVAAGRAAVATKLPDGREACCGSHGSLTPEELRIPFVLCSPQPQAAL